MRATSRHELPDDLDPVMTRAIRLEWISIAYLASVVVVMYLVMGNSQAMRTAWVEDILSLVPPIAFLVSAKIRQKDPSGRYPFGYHRVVSIAFLFAALALLTMGLLLLFDAVHGLIQALHPTLGSNDWFGEPIWEGWLMLPVLGYSVAGPVVLGWLKRKPAEALHDKTLFADAQMNKADWMTGLAAGAGVMGIGMGYWWADAVAAGLISASVLHDGWGNTRAVVTDLIDREPETVDHREPYPLSMQMGELLGTLPWVKDHEVRLRESGHVFFGEVWIVPSDREQLLERIRDVDERLRALDWRLHEVVIELTETIERPARDG